MNDQSTRLPPAACLCCGHVTDAATCLSAQRRPKPGDITLCFRCAHIMTFTETMALREATISDLLAIGQNGRDLLDHAQRAILASKAT